MLVKRLAEPGLHFAECCKQGEGKQTDNGAPDACRPWAFRTYAMLHRVSSSLHHLSTTIGDPLEIVLQAPCHSVDVPGCRRRFGAIAAPAGIRRRPIPAGQGKKRRDL